MEGHCMAKMVRVTILDDHQSVVDGYLYRLGGVPEVEVVATIMFGEETESRLVSALRESCSMCIMFP